MSLLWGIDLGGTKIEGVVLDETDPENPLARIRIDTEAERGYAHIVERIAFLMGELEAETGSRPRSVGIGTPGSRNPSTGLMRNCNTTCLNGKPLLADLEKRLAIAVHLANDANCFALAEARWGAARGFDTVFGVILGTGVGGGLVVHGRSLQGANGIAGEWGHNVLDPSGPPCYCGRRGCVETFLSGPANEREFERLTGLQKSMREIAESATDDSQSKAQIENLCARFGRAIAVVVNVFDPDAIVLGGGVGQIEALYSEGRMAATEWVFSDRFETPFLRPSLGDSAGVFGAAVLGQLPG